MMEEERSTETFAEVWELTDLPPSSVGPVRVGMPSEQVEALFGPPERKEEVNFGGDETAPQIDWIWDFEDDEFRLQFETQGGTVTGYVSNTAQLATKSGVSVGGRRRRGQ